MSAPGTFESTEFHLPHRVIRKLLRGRWRRRARNVLVAANHCTDMVHFLNRRGIDAVGIDDGQTTSDREAEKIHFGNIAGGFPFGPHGFDLVLVGNCRAFEHGLSGPEPFIAMANLLSSLRTRSRLVCLNPVVADGGAQDAEKETGRLEEGLSRFPGDVTVRDYHEGWRRFLSLEWLIGRHRDIQLQLTTLTVPRKPVSRLSWHQYARAASMRPPQTTQQERAA